jgi:Flp pilus assembly CpaE family ATPase
MLGARNAGVPLLEHAPKTKIHQSLMELANALCGKAQVDAGKKEKRGFFSFR